MPTSSSLFHSMQKTLHAPKKQGNSASIFFRPDMSLYHSDVLSTAVSLVQNEDTGNRTNVK